MKAKKKLQAANEELETLNQQLEESIERANRMVVETEIAQAELNQIFNAAGDGMCVIDEGFNVLRVNETFLTMCIEQGMGDYITKPLRRKKLLEMVE
jgi:PAS domain-containing protein